MNDMAYYVILDSTANLVDSFDDQDEARAQLEQIVQQDPDSAGDYALFTYDEQGHPVGEALIGSDLGVHA
jgi:Rieske Fe-S protein